MLAQGALVAMVDDTSRATGDESSQPARVTFGPVASDSTTVVVIHHVFDISPSPAAFTLSVSTMPL